MDPDLQIATYLAFVAILRRVAYAFRTDPCPLTLGYIYMETGLLECCRSRHDERAGDWLTHRFMQTIAVSCIISAKQGFDAE